METSDAHVLLTGGSMHRQRPSEKVAVPQCASGLYLFQCLFSQLAHNHAECCKSQQRPRADALTAPWLHMPVSVFSPYILRIFFLTWFRPFQRLYTATSASLRNDESLLSKSASARFASFEFAFQVRVLCFTISVYKALIASSSLSEDTKIL